MSKSPFTTVAVEENHNSFYISFSKYNYLSPITDRDAHVLRSKIVNYYEHNLCPMKLSAEQLKNHLNNIRTNQPAQNIDILLARYALQTEIYILDEDFCIIDISEGFSLEPKFDTQVYVQKKQNSHFRALYAEEKNDNLLNIVQGNEIRKELENNKDMMELCARKYMLQSGYVEAIWNGHWFISRENTIIKDFMKNNQIKTLSYNDIPKYPQLQARMLGDFLAAKTTSSNIPTKLKKKLGELSNSSDSGKKNKYYKSDRIKKKEIIKKLVNRYLDHMREISMKKAKESMMKCNLKEEALNIFPFVGSAVGQAGVACGLIVCGFSFGFAIAGGIAATTALPLAVVDFGASSAALGLTFGAAGGLIGANLAASSDTVKRASRSAKKNMKRAKEAYNASPLKEVIFSSKHAARAIVQNCIGKLFGFVPGESANISHMVFDELIDNLEVQINDKAVGEILRKIESASQTEKQQLLDDLLLTDANPTIPEITLNHVEPVDHSVRPVNAGFSGSPKLPDRQKIYVDPFNTVQDAEDAINQFLMSNDDPQQASYYRRSCQVLETPKAEDCDQLVPSGRNQFFEQVSKETFFEQNNISMEEIKLAIVAKWLCSREHAEYYRVTEIELLKTLQDLYPVKFAVIYKGQYFDEQGQIDALKPSDQFLCVLRKDMSLQQYSLYKATDKPWPELD